MSPIFRLLLVIFVLSLPSLTWAQPEPEDEDVRAKKHFALGLSLYNEGKLKESIGELRKAFALRPAPPILLNIGRTYEKLGKRQDALKSYQRFLYKARLKDPSRPAVEKMVRRVERELGIKHKATNTLTTPGAAHTSASGQKHVVSLQLIHTPIDAAKVRKSISVQAELPPDLGVDHVWVYYRKGGQRTFRKLEMKPQGDGFMAVIPGRRVTSTSIQYYLTAEKKGAGRRGVVANAGSRRTPHIIVVEGGRPPHLGPEKLPEIHSPYGTWLWVAAGASVALIGGGVASLLLAMDRESAVEDLASQSCPNNSCGSSPAIRFDQRDVSSYESQGKTFSTVGSVLLGMGIAAAGATGYLWYQDREYRAQEKARLDEDAHAIPTRRVVRVFAFPWAGPHAAGLAGQIAF
ncbi:MAG: tetratricopeptide repeat protein [Deltaproteobacteria bacterium]|nr:tetratricopeptide repeat protein [Deltaproteobacteria bacterium]